MSCIDELNQCPCDKIDANCIDAYIDASLNPDNPTHLVIGNSWGDAEVDLTPAIKAGETITHMLLSPEGNPTALQFNREDYGRDGAENGGVDCIEGDDLSRIISMHLLKDVDQGTPPKGGDVYMYDSNTDMFKTFALQDFVDATNQSIANLNQQVNQLQQAVSALQSQVNQLLQTTAKPGYVPANARLVWGTINNLNKTDPLNKGLYSHNPADSPSTNVQGDERFN